MMMQPGPQNQGAGGGMRAPPDNNPMPAPVDQSAVSDASLLGNQVYPFQCACGKGLAREREIQQHSNCQQFTTKYCNLLQAFVTLKHDACQNPNTLQSYQAKMSLYTLLTSFRADIKEHLTREQQVIMQAQGNGTMASGPQH